MKVLNIFGIAVLSTAMVLTGCQKEEDPKNEDPINNTPDPVEYTVEENKANMEAAGIELVTDLEELKNSEAIDVSNHLVSLMNTNDPFASEETAEVKKMGAFTILNALENFSQHGDINTVYGAMKSVSEGPSTPQEAFDALKGKYSWNATTQSWDVTEHDYFVLEFPASESAVTNNANFVVTYEAYTGTTPIPDYTGDLPKVITATLTVNENQLIAFNFESIYDTKGIPSILDVTLDVIDFQLAFNFTHLDNLLKFNYAFTKGTKTIFDLGAEANGDFSYTNIENMSNDSTYIQGPEDIKKIATSMDAHIQVLRYKIEGDIDLNGLIDDMMAAGGEEVMDDDSIAAEIVNNNYNLGVFDTENYDALVANTEFYVTEETYEWIDWQYDETTGEYVEVPVTETEEHMEMRFVYPDGSPADMEAFFQTGFETLQAKVEAFVTELEMEFGPQEETTVK